MNKIYLLKKLIFRGLLVLTPLFVNAQTTVTIGTGTSTTRMAPIEGYYAYSYTQMLYSATSIINGGWTGGPGEITKLRFYLAVAPISPSSVDNWTVYLANTNKTVMSNGSNGLEPVSNMTQVYSGQVTFPAAGNWMEINFTTPFLYAGGDLIVAVDEDAPGYSSSTSPSWQYTSTTNNSVTILYSDIENPSPASFPGSYAGNTTTNTSLPNIQLEIDAPSVCSGAVTAGAIQISQAFVSPGVLFDLSSSTATIGAGLTYLWQKNVNNTGWVNVGPATSVNSGLVGEVGPALGDQVDYRLIVECTNTGDVDTSTLISVISDYCFPSGTNASYYINNFSTTLGITNISNLASGYSTNGFGDYLVQSMSVYPGNSFNFSAVMGASSFSTFGFAIWVDWDNDGVYASSEQMFVSTSYANSFTGVVTVPAGTPVGNYRMRILADYNNSTPSDPCLISSNNGEVEEYTLSVILPPSCSTITFPTVNATASISSVCISDNVVFDIDTNVLNILGLTFQWEVSNDGGASWNSVGNINNYPNDTFLVNTSADYRVNVFCEGAHSFYSVPVSLSINNPAVVSTTDSSRCGEGVVVLDAIPSAGASINWYASTTGGAPIGTGAPFTTPYIQTTTTFYAAAIVGASSVNVVLGQGASTTNTQSTYEGTSPFAYHYGNYKHQILILASELQALGLQAGPITEIGFHVTSAGSATFNNFNVTLLHTSSSALTSTFVTGGTSVFSGSYTPVVGVNMISFATPFIWDGSSNVVVQTCFMNNNSGSNANSAEVQYDATPFVSHIIYRGDGSSTNACTQTAGNSSNDGPITSKRPKMYIVGTGGCVSPRIPVVANVVLPPAITVSATDTIICKGFSTTISVTSSNPGYTYEWTPGNLSGASHVVTPLVSQQYIVVASDLTTGPNEGCVISDTINIAVDSLLTPVLQVSDDSICSGQSVMIHIVNELAVGGNSLTTNSLYTNPFYHLYGGVKTQYLILASELQSLGLFAGANLKSLMLDFTASNNHAFNGFSISMGHTSLMQLSSSFVTGLSSVYSSTSFTPVVGLNTMSFDNAFVWDGVSNVVVQFCWSNNNSGSSSNTPTIRYSNTSFVSGVYQRQDNQSVGVVCGNSTTFGNVSGRPWMSFASSLSSSIDLLWTPTGLATDTINYTPFNSGNSPITESHTLTLTDNISGCSASNSISFVVKPQAVANIVAPQNYICSNDSNGFYLDGQNSLNATVYDWNMGETNNPTYLVTAPGMYHLSVNNVFNCGDEDSVLVTVVNPIVPSVIITSISPTQATLDAGSGFVDYSWNTLQTTSSIVVTEPGTYFVTVTDSNGCVSVSSPVVLTNISINEQGQELRISIFPNPSNGNFAIQLDNLLAPELQIQLMDANGRVIYMQQLQNLPQNYTHYVDLNGLAAGNYFVQLLSPFGSETRQVIIVR